MDRKDLTPITHYKATPIKIKRTDTWGARIANPTVPVTVGDVVEITTKGGKSWSAKVAKIVATYPDATVVETRTAASAPRASRYRDVESCGYPCPVDGHRCTPDRPCHDCL